jgi:hypothetical protein
MPDFFKNHYKHMQHTDEILANIHMKQLKTLEKYVSNIKIYLQHPVKTLITYVWNNETFRIYT